jgi:hypothetical protein
LRAVSQFLMFFIDGFGMPNIPPIPRILLMPTRRPFLSSAAKIRPFRPDLRGGCARATKTNGDFSPISRKASWLSSSASRLQTRFLHKDYPYVAAFASLAMAVKDFCCRYSCHKKVQSTKSKRKAKAGCRRRRRRDYKSNRQGKPCPYSVTITVDKISMPQIGDKR